jgi:hypothetical protein
MRSVVPRERTTFVCDVHVPETIVANVVADYGNVGGKLRRYSGKAESWPAFGFTWRDLHDAVGRVRANATAKLDILALARRIG